MSSVLSPEASGLGACVEGGRGRMEGERTEGGEEDGGKVRRREGGRVRRREGGKVRRREGGKVRRREGGRVGRKREGR